MNAEANMCVHLRQILQEFMSGQTNLEDNKGFLLNNLCSKNRQCCQCFHNLALLNIIAVSNFGGRSNTNVTETRKD